MQHTEKMLELRDKLIRLGHDAYTTGFAPSFVGKSDDEKQTIKVDQQYNQDANSRVLGPYARRRCGSRC